jgi:hypothetical protein
MLEGVIESIWERVHSEAERWVAQAASLARYKGEMVRVGEENRRLRAEVLQAQRVSERHEKTLETLQSEAKAAEAAVVLATGVEEMAH